MIAYLPFVGFVLGALLAYGSAGRRRLAGTMVMVLATAWALAQLINPAASAWAVVPVLTAVLLPRAPQRVASSFEGLTRRTITIGGLTVLALFLASQLPVGFNPVLLSAVPWLLGAVGTAWMLSPIDARERLQGQALMVAATAAVILTANPAGGVTAAAAGALAIAPLIGQRQLADGLAHQLLSSLMLLVAAAAAAVAVSGIVVPPLRLFDLTVGFSGPVLLGVALVCLAAAIAAPPGSAWTGLVAGLALLAVSPALRWPAIAALVAVATGIERDGERPAWLATAALAAVPVLQGIAPPRWSLRAQTVALGIGLVLALYAARGGVLRSAYLPAIGFLVLASISALTAGNLTRLQWIAAVGALLLVGRTLLLRATPRSAAPVPMTDPLIMGLLLLAISARDALALGALASVLLLLDLAIIRPRTASIQPAALWDRLTLLARSNWPPSVRFAGGTLAVIAALQASLALGLLAALMLAALQLAPLLDRRAVERMTDAPISTWRWLAPLVSLASGLAPSVVLRMLRL